MLEAFILGKQPTHEGAKERTTFLPLLSRCLTNSISDRIFFAPIGHISTHLPQAMHKSSITEAQLLDIFIAFTGQYLTHL